VVTQKIVTLWHSDRHPGTRKDQLAGKTMELEEEDPERTRFLVELEFVQCLANPHYLRWLATEGYLRDEKFIRYLEYLQYWKKPEYAKFIIYPHCLRFLDLLQHEEIRVHLIENSRYSLEIADQQFYHWLYRRKQAQLPADMKASQDGSSATEVAEDKAAQAMVH
jgi:mediator of RNA polymerase II transcription subunit 31